jgi:hypothetical protein
MTWSHQIKLTCGRRSERLHPNPAFGGGAQEAETLLPVGSLDQRTYRFGHLRSVGTGEVLEDGDGVVWRGFQAGFITAPSMTTPAETYLHRATSSLRARATTVVFRIRPALRWTRSWNHRLSAEAGWF